MNDLLVERCNPLIDYLIIVGLLSMIALYHPSSSIHIYRRPKEPMYSMCTITGRIVSYMCLVLCDCLNIFLKSEFNLYADRVLHF